MASVDGTGGVTGDSADAASTLPLRDETDTLVGERFDRYVVGARLGRGGMGVVHSAHDAELGRDVALKILRTRERDAAHERARMLREAQALAQLSHPNVVTVFGCGTWRDRVYIAMELVRGETLRAWQHRLRPGWREIVSAVTAAGRALAAAHAVGIVHRDVKPDNVLMGDDGRVLLVDFGIATSHAETGSDGDGTASGAVESEPLTVAGTVMGTLGYMAPELLGGARASPASDQFGLCVTLFELLHGERPYAPGPHERADMRAHRVRPPRPGVVVPARVRRAMIRGLAPEPSDRWPSVDALLAELNHRPARWPWVLGGLATSALVGGVFASGNEPCRGAGSHLDAVWSRQRRDAIELALEQSSGTRAAQSVPALLEQIDARATAWRDANATACADRNNHLDARMACLRRQLGELDAAISVLAEVDVRGVGKAATVITAMPDPTACLDDASTSAIDRPELDEIRARLARAAALANVGRHPDALALAIEIAADTEPEWATPVRPAALLRLAQSLWTTGDLVPAEARFLDALLAAEAQGDEPVAARAAVDLVMFLAKADRAAEAEAMVPRARAAIARIGDDTRLLAYLEGNIGMTLVAAGREPDALPHYEESLRLREELLGTDHPDTLAAVNSLGIIFARLGRTDEARVMLERAVAGLDAAYGPDHPDTGSTATNLASLINQTDPAAALPLRERALATFQASFDPTHPLVATGHNSLGLTLRKLGREPEALGHFELALRAREARLGAEHPDTLAALANLSTSLANLGRHADALALRHRQLDALERVWGPAAVELVPAHVAIARQLDALGRAGDAAQRLERARMLADQHDSARAREIVAALAAELATP